MRRPGEEGVALLTVLLLVAVMSTLAVGVLDDIRFGMRRSANAQAVSQARWYAIGAETLARTQLARLAGTSALSGAAWSGRVFHFPVEGGQIQSRVSDGANCFNLNSVVEGAGELYRARALGVTQFKALATALGISDAEAGALAGALVDWIDTDPLREPGGAEDEAYPRYRTSGALLSEVSELRAIRGFGVSAYARLRPYVCALPTSDLSPINVNTLTVDRAVLLTALTENGVTVAAARRVITERPAAGWSDVASFWAVPGLADGLPAGMDVNQVTVTPRFFNLETQVSYRDAEVAATALIERDRAGRLVLAARRWTRDE